MSMIRQAAGPASFLAASQLDQQLVAGQLLLAQLMQAPLPVPPDG